MRVARLVLLAHLALGLAAAGSAPAAHAQEGRDRSDSVAVRVDTALVRIVLTDGSVLNGVVTDSSAAGVTIRTVAGARITVSPDAIRSITPIEGRIVRGAVRRLDPNRTRLLFAPTARPLAAGRGYFADYYVFFPFAAVGLTDRFTIAGGISIVPGLALTEQLLYFAPKVTVFDGTSADVAAGVLVGTAPSADDYGGIVYGIGTVGSPERAVTAGLGFAFSSGEAEASPVVVLGGEVQVSNTVKLITENHLLLFDEGTVLFSGGIRFFGDALAADLGVLTFPELLNEVDGLSFVPLVSFAYNFGE